jgi:hypothetical protein
MKDVDKLRVLLPHWIEHNDEHSAEFREWAQRAGEAQQHLLKAAQLLEDATASLQSAMEKLGGPLSLEGQDSTDGHH